jgi:hypothetical protein
MTFSSLCSDIKITHTIIKGQGMKMGITFQTLPQHAHIATTTIPYTLARLEGKFHRILECAVVGSHLKTVTLRTVLHGP